MGVGGWLAKLILVVVVSEPSHLCEWLPELLLAQVDEVEGLLELLQARHARRRRPATTVQAREGGRACGIRGVVQHHVRMLRPRAGCYCVGRWVRRP